MTERRKMDRRPPWYPPAGRAPFPRPDVKPLPEPDVGESPADTAETLDDSIAIWAKEGGAGDDVKR